MRRQRSPEGGAKPAKVARTSRGLQTKKKRGEKAKDEHPLHVVLERQALSGPSAAGADAVGPLVDLIVGALDVEDPSTRLPALLSANRVFTHFQKSGTLVKQQKAAAEHDGRSGEAPAEAVRRAQAQDQSQYSIFYP